MGLHEDGGINWGFYSQTPPPRGNKSLGRVELHLSQGMLL